MENSTVSYNLSGNNPNHDRRAVLFAPNGRSDPDHLFRDKTEQAEVYAVYEPVRLAKFLIKTRRAREQFLEGIEFGEPAWDVLLDLFVAREEGRSISSSSLCIAAAVPATTGLRWITGLVKSRYLLRRPDPRDNRRVFIELTDQTAEMVRAHLEHVSKLFSLMVDY